MTASQQVLFCAKYLSERGYSSHDFDDLVEQSKKLKVDYNLVKKEPTTFFFELAEKLRELWPPGEKEGKYPWRDSVDNLRRRLMELWATKLAGKTFTVEECLVVARKYLSQFQHDTKYMMILKYFILKNGTSKFANMLLDDEFIVTAVAEESEYDNISEGEGVLI